MKILIADDHPFTLQGTKFFVESFGHKVIDTCSNGTSALNLITLHQPDVAILDINMPGLDGLDVSRKIQESKLRTKVILLTMHKENTLYKKASEYEIYGYILKEHAQTELEKCLNEIQNGRRYVSTNLEEDLITDTSNSTNKLQSLTLSERKIIELIAQNKTSKQIAEMLFLSERTIEGHRANIIEKLDLTKEKNTLLKWALRNIE
jgi:DNA-binding NarL/FixJ family response regulator